MEMALGNEELKRKTSVERVHFYAIPVKLCEVVEPVVKAVGVVLFI